MFEELSQYDLWVVSMLPLLVLAPSYAAVRGLKAKFRLETKYMYYQTL